MVNIMDEIGNDTFEHILNLAASFDRHADEESRAVSWKEMIAEIEALPIEEQHLVLGLVRTKMKAQRNKYNSQAININ